MLGVPLTPPQVRLLIQGVLNEGDLEFSAHALQEMKKDGLSELDIVNVLRGSWPEPGEYEHGSWRYRISTQQITVVISFRDDSWLVVVTAWRE